MLVLVKISRFFHYNIIMKLTSGMFSNPVLGVASFFTELEVDSDRR